MDDPKLYLFGSRARGDHNPDSDWDVFLYHEDYNNDAEDMIQLLEPYCVENGGKLDLFIFMGDCLLCALHPDDRRIILNKWRFADLKAEAKEIDINNLLYQLTRTKLTDFGTVRDGNGNYIG